MKWLFHDSHYTIILGVVDWDLSERMVLTHTWVDVDLESEYPVWIQTMAYPAMVSVLAEYGIN